MTLLTFSIAKNSFIQILMALTLIKEEEMNRFEFHLEGLTESNKEIDPSLRWIHNIIQEFNIDPFPSKIDPSYDCYVLPYNVVSREIYARFPNCIFHAEAFDNKNNLRLSHFDHYTLEIIMYNEVDFRILNEYDICFDATLM